jgi:hypothetical protein
MLKPMPVRSLARSLPSSWLEHALLAYLRPLGQPKRWRIAFEDAAGPTDGGVLLFWHADLLLAPVLSQRFPNAAVLVSRSRDGSLAARAVEAFGVEALRGSRGKPGKRDKGGLAAMAAMQEALALGRWVAITPDGPRGPARKCAPAIAQLARFSAAPVRCVGFAARPCLRLRTWDALRLPAPWAEGAAVVSAPLRLERRADAQACARFCTEIEAALETAAQRAGMLLHGSRA